MARKVLLYYKFISVPSPEKEVSEHKEICEQLSLTGRIIISQEGINGTLEGEVKQLKLYQNYLNFHPLFANIDFKETPSFQVVFKKLKIRARAEIVTLEHKVNLKNAGKKINPKELHQLLEKEEDVVLIDMRNGYESKIGKFKGAVTLQTENFRDLPGEVSSLEKFKNKKVVTYCTGGIRCEKASALLVENGFKEVYQLNGGIFNYVKEYPDGFFEGKCFVFDSRMSLNFNQKQTAKVLSSCEYCQKQSDSYVDCANLKCHRLFIACKECQNEFNNFCSSEARTKTNNFTSPQNYLN